MISVYLYNLKKRRHCHHIDEHRYCTGSTGAGGTLKTKANLEMIRDGASYH